MPAVRSLGPAALAIFNLLYWPYLIATTAALFVPALALYLLTFWQRPRRWLHAYTSYWAAHYLAWAPFAGVRVEGRERLVRGASVIVVNHQSMVDILAVYAIHWPFLWVSKRENFYAPFLGWNMWLNGYVPLKRGRLASIRKMLRTCEARLREGSSLCVFPEGTRSRDGNLEAFYRGAFWIAVRNGVPVVPIVIDGTHSILSKGKLGIRPRKVLVRVLEPVRPEQADDNDRRLRDLVFQRMHTEIASLRAQAGVQAEGPAEEPTR